MNTFTIDADFPGGNIVLEQITWDTVTLRQDLRDTEGDWFYWAFRVRGAGGHRMNFRFTGSDVLGARGAAVSLDGGASWSWLGAESVHREDGHASFAYDFAAGADEVFLAFCPLYTQKNWDEFLNRHSGSSLLRREVLCRSRAGREVELLHLGSPLAPYRVLLTARHHACETMASFALEGVLEAVLGDDDLGAWLRANVGFAAVPFMDTDGVEAGDQGKNRKPYDHNRDYAGEPEDCLYPEVRSLRQWAPGWLRKSESPLMLDMHCPWIRFDRNEEVYFVGVPDQRNWERLTEFSRGLEANARGSLPFQTANNLPHGVDWNTLEGTGLGAVACARWGAQLPSVHLSTSIEVPYANAGGAEVTPASARALGRDIAVAIRVYLGTLDAGNS